ncbi:MAG: GIY-YIG nuclease family protein [bacterium]|nr:GIY-YIG nuclease family protein [bacterium]
MVYIYVIKSLKHPYRYVGITNNIERRLNQHNLGYNKITKPYVPFKMLFSENYPDYKEARRREKFLKSGQGRKFLDSLK